MQMKIRTTEGEYGEITATIVGNSVPTKSAVVVKLPVKPLSLHCRAGAFREDVMQRELNVLTLRGSFSVNVAHEWMRACVPEIPPYVESDEVKVRSCEDEAKLQALVGGYLALLSTLPNSNSSLRS